MGLVSQEPVLFSTTIKENVLYGKKDATDEEIEDAIKLANAANFIDRLPNGLDTLVGENGAQLSGGQKQRIAIARAILKNPKILLLDEATSALDTASERMVQEALEKVMPNRTTLVVAHRLSTVKNVDLIAVVHAGKLIEQGPHDDLIQDPDGVYRQLVSMQEGSPLSETKIQNYAAKIDSSIETNNSNMSRFNHETNTKEDHIGKGETNLGKKTNLSIRRLSHLNKPELPALLIGSVAASIHGVAFPAFGLLMATAIGIFFETHSQLHKDSRHWALTFIGVGAVLFIVVPIQNYLFGISGGKLVQRIRSLTFEKVVHQEIGWFDDPANSSGAVGARLSTDASTVRNLVGDTLALAVQNSATTIAGVFIAFSVNWKLALIVIVIMPLTIMEGYFRMNLLKEGDDKVIFEEASQVANDAIGGIRTVASFSAEEKVLEMYQRKCNAPMKRIWQGIVGGASLGIANFVLFSIYAYSFYVGAVLTKHGEAQFIEVFKVFFAIQVSSLGISQSSGIFADFCKFKESAASIFEILDRETLIDSSNHDGLELDTLNGDIELRHVSFKYPTRPDIQIFRDMSLCISSGKTTALVGESGSGKSTVISLLLRFYDLESGQIFLDGVKIRKFNLTWLRQQMGFVSQEPILFNETIRDNISCGRSEVTEEEIIIASKAAHAHNFISSLPQGYNTNVGEKGVQLSGGQKQRIAIARAILKDPRILLLDEATSALDTESERVVMDALDRITVDRTTLVVAHRLSTVKGADVINVMKDGVVAEKGTHDVLMGVRGGIYANLVALNANST